MSLRIRLAATFALVALLTGLAVVITAPTIVGRGFASLEGDAVTPGQGPGRGPMAGLHLQQIQQETTQTIIVVALLAAAGASLVGFVIAGRIAAPLRRLEEAAGAVAGGDLARRSGLADRADEIGALGRSFDTMAAELEADEASRRRFFQDVAHELKTPLAVIEATSTAVLDGVYEHDDRHLETIRGQSRILARIVDDLRTISLAESGDLPLALDDVDLADVAETALRGFGARAQVAGVRLEGGVPGGLVVRADRDRLAQVLGALLDNALRHAPAGGTVTLAASADRAADGDGVRITVTDTGPGLTTEAAAHAFDRFYQADPARDRASGTSGLGLSIVRALVQAHGGSVGVDPRPGTGARFWFRLPSPRPS
jgi:two-component system, OmpR family, sensor histidine kinase BaeS